MSAGRRGALVDVVIALAPCVSRKTLAEVMAVEVATGGTVETGGRGAVVGFCFTVGTCKAWSAVTPVHLGFVSTGAAMMAYVMKSYAWKITMK